MEQELFKWDGWQQDDTMIFGFYNVELIQKIGDYPVGTKFDFASMDYENGKLTFYNKGGDAIASFKLHIAVAEKL